MLLKAKCNRLQLELLNIKKMDLMTVIDYNLMKKSKNYQYAID